MPLGPLVRRLFGVHEHRIAALYRSIFIDLDDYVGQIGAWVPDARRVLEVGCGEGAVTERLVELFPDAEIMAIDVTPRVGRLFRGDRTRVTFAETTVQAVAAQRPAAFDLVIISDVLHHVPPPIREELMAAVRAAIAPGGALIFKDWAYGVTPIHWLCHASDRWLTGDRVRYLRKADADAMLAELFDGAPMAAEARIAPWRNNFAVLARA